jgi:hypothetical protein
MRSHFLIAALVTISSLGQVKAQDAYIADSNELAAKQVVIAGTKKGKCTPEMPMLKPGVYSLELQATADANFVLDSEELGLHMEVAPGQTQATLFTFVKGNFNFVCGDKALLETKRTRGMFMVM